MTLFSFYGLASVMGEQPVRVFIVWKRQLVGIINMLNATSMRAQTSKISTPVALLFIFCSVTWQILFRSQAKRKTYVPCPTSLNWQRIKELFNAAKTASSGTRLVNQFPREITWNRFSTFVHKKYTHCSQNYLSKLADVKTKNSKTESVAIACLLK